MKKMIATACAVVASSIALASTVESSNTFGVLKVDTGITNGTVTNQYFISVPWKTVGGSSEIDTIDPKELVLPSNLNKDDRLYVYSGGSFKPWVVQVQNENTENETKVWAAGGYTDPQGNSYSDPTDGTVNRGDGIVIETSASAIYLTGQYSGDNTKITLAGPTVTDEGKTPGYTLLGAKLAKSYDLNTEVTWDGVEDDDMILLNGGKITMRINGVWSNIDDKSPVLDIGTGAWYVRYGTKSTKASVTFETPKTTSND